MAGAIDRNTGLPTNVSLANQNFAQTGTQTTAPATVSTTGNVRDRTEQAVTQTSSSINAPAAALEALNTLIAQLTDRPAINQAEVEAKFPLATRQFHPQYGWYWTLPNGMSTDEQGAKAFNNQQLQKRQATISEAGVIKGGTERQKETEANRKQEITTNRALQQQYSKEAAMADSAFLVNKAIADALEAAMPQITAGLEGAGTSRSTLASAAVQRAATKGATEGAALGAQLSTQYGQLSVGLANVLEELTRSDPNSPEAMLLQAIIGSKGLVTAGSSSQTGDTTSNKTVNETKNTGPVTTNTTLNRQAAPNMPLLTPSSPNTYNMTKSTSGGTPFYAFAETTDAITPTLQANFNSMFEPDVSSIYDLEES